MKVQDTIQLKGLVIPESNKSYVGKEKGKEKGEKRDRYFTPISINIIEWKM